MATAEITANVDTMLPEFEKQKREKEKERKKGKKKEDRLAPKGASPREDRSDEKVAKQFNVSGRRAQRGEV